MKNIVECEIEGVKLNRALIYSCNLPLTMYGRNEPSRRRFTARNSHVQVYLTMKNLQAVWNVHV